MEKQSMERGFITVATGSDHYYRLARQLLRSYRCCCKEPVPFALICDRENADTAEFDCVIILDHPSGSYLDKLSICRYSPFEETIFIDADSIILKDPSGLWEDFSLASAVSCYGKVFPNGSEGGWFLHEKIGKWKESVKYQIGLHGGVYYFRNDAKAQLVFHTAVQLTQEYDDYGFREFSKPADEPVMALSMAIHDCRPVEKEGQVIFFHAIYGRLRLNDNGDLCLDGVPCDAIVCHFATKNTYCFTYQYLSEMVNIRYLDPRDETLPDSFSIRKRTLKYDIKNWMKYSVKRVVRRILPRKISRA